MERLQLDTLLASYPAADKEKAAKLLAAELEKDPRKIVVLDDDPTGVQTVHDISVYTDWSVESIQSVYAHVDEIVYAGGLEVVHDVCRITGQNQCLTVGGSFEFAGEVSGRSYVVVI